MKIMVTGVAGFIGLHTALKLLERGDEIVGVDNINDYYDVKLKEARLAQLEDKPGFTFYHIDISDCECILKLFDETHPQKVIHLAAQPGVRYSLINPHAYVKSNLVGFVNILEGCRHNDVEHLVYASSSSVYGANTNYPFSVEDNVDNPVSLYAATKKSNELMAHTYSHLFLLPTTGLRFFTVYGPWGRPDMAPFIFTKSILEGKPIDIFNYGDMKRDFTYVDDIAEGIIRTCDHNAKPDPNWSGNNPIPGTSNAPYRIYNIGNNNPVSLTYFIETIENCLGIKAIKNYLPMQAGDIPITYANVDALINDVGFRPSVSIEDGIAHFVEWYRSYYNC